MAEYLLYSNGALFGGVSDNRLLFREQPTSAAMLSATDLPREGTRPIRLADLDDGEAAFRFVAAACAGLR